MNLSEKLEYIIGNNIKLLLETIELSLNLRFEDISPEEDYELLNSEDFTLTQHADPEYRYSYRRWCEGCSGFQYSNHYAIYFLNKLIGTIAFNNYFDTFINVDQYDCPIGKPAIVTKNPIGRPLSKPYKMGARTLFVMSLELSKSLRSGLNYSPMSIIYSIFEYIKDYAELNDFENIICGAKDKRVARLYERAGFKNLMPNAEKNILMEYKLEK